jgi:hypothetical protein
MTYLSGVCCQFLNCLTPISAAFGLVFRSLESSSALVLRPQTRLSRVAASEWQSTALIGVNLSLAAEGVEVWLQVLTDLRSLGVADIFIACVDAIDWIPQGPCDDVSPTAGPEAKPSLNF